MKLVRKKKVSVNLNIAPLIDIVFLLIIFFMLSSKFIADRGIKIKLPESESAHQQEQTVTVFIEKNGAVTINGKTVNDSDMEKELSLLVKDNKGSHVIIRADREVELQRAVTVIDAAKKAEASGIIISTQETRHEQ